MPLAPLTNATFMVKWSGADDAGGSGLASFDVFVSENDGPYALWQTATTQTSATFTGMAGHTYRFYSRAADHFGHVELAPLSADAFTQISTHPWHNVLNSLDVTGPGGNPDGIVTAVDALAIIDFINAFGVGVVPTEATSGPPYYDTTGDDSVVPQDVLDVINFINAFGAGLPGPAGEGEASAFGRSTRLVTAKEINATGPTAVPGNPAASWLTSQPYDLVFAEISTNSKSQPPFAQIDSSTKVTRRQPATQKDLPQAGLAPSSGRRNDKVLTDAFDDYFAELTSKSGRPSRHTIGRGQLRRHV
jgi:hypothetical protein